MKCSTGLPWAWAAKRQVWRRITLEHTAWRFTRYAERAAKALPNRLRCSPQRSPGAVREGDQTAMVAPCCA